MKTTNTAGNGTEQVRPALNGVKVKLDDKGQIKTVETAQQIEPVRNRTVEDIANIANRIQQMISKLRSLRETMERISTMSAAQNPGQDTLKLTIGGEHFQTSHPVFIDMVLKNATTYINSEMPKLEAELLATI